jgi:hypothetical protein
MTQCVAIVFQMPSCLGISRPFVVSRYGGANAIWHIARTADVPQLRSFLEAHSSEFVHQGVPVSQQGCKDVVFDHMYFIGPTMVRCL